MNLLDLVGGRGTLLVMALSIGGLVVATEAPRAHARVVVTDTETTILDIVEFAPGTATLLARSTATLDAVAETMRGNPSIELIEVQSHVRDLHDGEIELDLTQQRAEAVMAYLVAHGVEPARLTAQGYGATQPIDRAAPAKNDRIAFLILKRSSDDR